MSTTEAILVLPRVKGTPKVMTLTARTKVTVLNHTDPERKPRTGFRRPKCIGSKAFVKSEKALDLPPSGPAKHPLATVSAQV